MIWVSLFFQSFNNYLLSTNYVPYEVRSTVDKMTEQIYKLFMGIIF